MMIEMKNIFREVATTRPSFSTNAARIKPEYLVGLRDCSACSPSIRSQEFSDYFRTNPSTTGNMATRFQLSRD